MSKLLTQALAQVRELQGQVPTYAHDEDLPDHSLSTPWIGIMQGEGYTPVASLMA